MSSPAAAKPGDFEFAVEDGPLPDFGKKILERDLPSDLALVTPTVIRAVECLRGKSLCSSEDESRVCLCLWN